MAILYLTEQRSWVSREGDCLIIHMPEQNGDKSGKVKQERKKTIPLMKIEEVMVIGDITLTTPAIERLLEAKAPIIYLTQYGRYLGSLFPAQTKNSLLRLAQHEAHHQFKKRHVIAQQFVVGKLRNMRTVLMRYHRTYPDATISAQIEQIKQCIRCAEQNITLQSSLEPGDIDDQVEMDAEEIELGRMGGLGALLGWEGAGSAAYFQSFCQLIKCRWPHRFSRRTRRPPTDPVNALLSYGYVILASQVASTLAAVGFDPYIGYLHASRYGKPALALDLMEEFRPLIVDSTVLSILNNHQLEERDFTMELNACRMTDSTRRLFLQKFEDRMQETIKHPIFDYTVSYRRCIELQARLLGKFLTGEVETYTPFTVR